MAVATAVGLGCAAVPATAAETMFTGGTNNSTTWNTAANWSQASVPATGDVADVFKTTAVAVSYNVYNSSSSNLSSPADLKAVQIAGNTSTGTAIFSLTASGTSLPYLKTGSLYVGVGVTGQNGYARGAGPGEVVQSAGTLTIDSPGVLQIDTTSYYLLSGSGLLSANNETNAGTFTQSGGSNILSTGMTLNNSGTYTATGTGVLQADVINNTGTFNLSGGTVEGFSTIGTSLANNGTFTFTSGTFAGMLTNNSILNITSTSLGFTGTLVNNGKTTVTGASGPFTAAIQGGGILVFNGAGSNVTLTGTNTYTGQTTVAAGTLTLNSPVGVAGNNYGGALEGSVIVDAGTTLVNAANSQIANTASLTINGGTYDIGNYNQTVGSLTMDSGMVMQTTGPGLGVASGSVISEKGTTATITGGLRSSSAFTFNVGQSGTLNVIGPVGGYNAGSTALIMTGGGVLTLSAASSLSSIDVKQGTLQISETGTLGGVNVSTTVESGGTLSLTNQALTIGDLNGAGGVALGTGSLTVVSTGSIYPGTIAGSGTLTKAGAGMLTLSGADSSSGFTDVASGNLTVAGSGSISGSTIQIETFAIMDLYGTINSSPAINDFGSLVLEANPGSGILVRRIGNLTIGTNTGGGNGQVQIAAAANHGNRTLLVDTGVTIAGTTSAWTGTLDLTNNDMDVVNSTLSLVQNQVKQGYNGGLWTGNGITSSTAAADTTHLTAIGVILNNDGFGNPLYGTGTTLKLFDGQSPGLSDILVKYTYYGDANLDGKVDGSDYARIDNGFLQHLTGWYNGDFNYDGVVNGSDYTLIDNTFNQQGAALSETVASSAAQVAGTSAVPEPVGAGLLGLASIGLLRRRRGCKAASIQIIRISTTSDDL
jgi:autotransporter-associated beta strand protein